MPAIIRAPESAPVGLQPRAMVLLLLGFYCVNYMTLQGSAEENMSPDRVYRAVDPQSNLECSLTILRGGDGGASAVVVELRNASTDQDLVLKVNTEMSAFIMLTVTDEQGTVLSEPAKKFNSSEPQQFHIVRIRRASSDRWRVRTAAQLDAGIIPEQGLKGRLVVNVALLFSLVSGDEQPGDADFKSSLLTLYDMDVVFTKGALSEGIKSPTADR